MRETELKIFHDGAEIPFPPGSARGISGSAPTPIREAAQMRRDVNGVLRDISRSLFRKYECSISCADVRVPAIAHVWPGDMVTIHSVARFTQTYTGDPTTLERDPVPGSVEAFDANDDEVELTVIGRDVTATSAAYVVYRPILTCRVARKSGGWDEYADAEDWSLDLEEV